MEQNNLVVHAAALGEEFLIEKNKSSESLMCLLLLSYQVLLVNFILICHTFM